jgi:transcriptional regulator with XRE-family HTH domain
MSETQPTVINKRATDRRDLEIGKRIRALRLERGISQTELGNMVGVTFQQIQKYEKGANRVAAGRLHRLSEVLKAPITFFYAEPASGHDDVEIDSIDIGLGFLESPGAVRLVRAYSRIQDVEMKRTLVDLAEKIAG